VISPSFIRIFIRSDTENNFKYSILRGFIFYFDTASFYYIGIHFYYKTFLAMDLYSGLPYWIAKNPLYNHFNPLKSNYSVDVVIIGTGITGTLIAHELCSAGIQCIMVDKRTVSTGSSIASTALLQYEIDTPLSELSEKLGDDMAVKAYRASLQSISDIEHLFEKIGINPDLEKVPSVFYASNRKGLKLIQKELEIRKKYNLPVQFLNKKELYEKYGIDAPGALKNNVSAQIDAYKAAISLIDYHIKNSNLQVFSQTNIEECDENPFDCRLITQYGNEIKCNSVVIATGFEAGKFLPKEVMKLTSTYAIISEPIEEKYLWKDRSLFWETKEPYLYVRTDGKNRVIAGGEDEDFKNPVLRDILLKKKVRKLEKKIKNLFPYLPFKTEMAWCGTFSSTKDGLPFIGNWPGEHRKYYALGYGGNGITFSMIAAQIIKNKLTGVQDDREIFFGFERQKFASPKEI
jgi:glycine/D-amino acid oxidase-like deaminating enzyme